MARKVLHLAAQLEELLPTLRPHIRRWHGAGHRVSHVLGEPAVHAFRQPVDQLGRESERLADLADRHARLERDDVADHPGPLPAVLVVDILDHLLAVLGGEIDIDVGRARHLLVQEAFEEEVVLDRVDAGDAEHVRDDRVGCRSAALAGHAMLARESHQVPVDEEELGETSLFDHLQLALQPLRDGERDRPVSLPHALETELVEK